MSRLYGRWDVTLPGEQYVWEPDDMPFNDWLMLERELEGETFDEWVNGIDQRRAVPCQVLVWYLRYTSGRPEDRMTVNFPIRRLELKHIEEVADDPEASAGSEPATSQSSPESSESDPGSGETSPGLTSVA